MAWVGWTDDAISTMRLMWEAGKTDTAIMAAIGAPSRNCIVGKLTRLKLTRCPGAKQEFAAKRAKMLARRLRCATTKPVSEPPMPVAEPVAITAPVDPFAMFVDGGLTIVELKTLSCRFPSGDPKEGMRYCGAVAHGIGPYCLFHHKVAFSGFTKFSDAPNRLRIGR